MTEQSDAQQDRVKRHALIDSIKQRRQKIQLAAEFLRPSDDSAHAPHPPRIRPLSESALLGLIVN